MLRRLPKLRDILPVYAAIATIVFGWSLLAFIWKLPSWILFLNLGEIFSIFSYTLSVDFLESLFWLVLILVLSMLLPATALKDHFAVRGTILSLLVLSSLALFINRYGEWGRDLLSHTGLWIVVTLLLAILMVFLSAKFAFLARAAIWIADRLIIFLYLYIPLAVVALLVVLIRNIF